MKNLPRPVSTSGLVHEGVRSGSIAALAMIPFGLLFFSFGLRINEYGMKVIQTLFGDAPAGIRFALFAIEHCIISWSAAIPLLILLVAAYRKVPPLLVGALYGAGFYIVVNSVALPWIFGDLTPWQLGRDFVYPSLVVHLVYGLTIVFASRAYVALHARQPQPAMLTTSRANKA